jgi:hypothetical protein
MYAALGGADTGVPKKVAKEFIEATPKKRFAKLKEKIDGKKK